MGPAGRPNPRRATGHHAGDLVELEDSNLTSGPQDRRATNYAIARAPDRGHGDSPGLARMTLRGRSLTRTRQLSTSSSLRVRHLHVTRVAQRLEVGQVVVAAPPVALAVARDDVVDLQAGRRRAAGAPVPVTPASLSPRLRPAVVHREAPGAHLRAPPATTRTQVGAAHVAPARLIGEWQKVTHPDSQGMKGRRPRTAWEVRPVIRAECASPRRKTIHH